MIHIYGAFVTNQQSRAFITSAKKIFELKYCKNDKINKKNFNRIRKNVKKQLSIVTKKTATATIVITTTKTNIC